MGWRAEAVEAMGRGAEAVEAMGRGADTLVAMVRGMLPAAAVAAAAAIGLAMLPAVAVADVGVDEKLGDTVPLDVPFLDENGRKVLLKDLVDRPTVLSLVYFRCPGICGPLLGGISDVVDRLDLKAGTDYRVLTISFNPADTPELAIQKKSNYFKAFHKDMPLDAWRFLTGTPESIAAITGAVGFKYEPAGSEFIHPATIMVLSPKGKIARYLYGVTFLPFDLKMALTEAAEGRVGATINKVLLFCFSYDPEGKTYVFNILKITGIVTLLVVGLFGLFLAVTTRRYRAAVQQDGQGEGGTR